MDKIQERQRVGQRIADFDEKEKEAKEFIESIKRAKNNVKDGLLVPMFAMLPEDIEYVSLTIRQRTMIKNQQERQRVGQRIAELRTAKGMTQSDLADRTGILRPHISRIEQGKYSVGLDTLAVIAEALGCTIDFIEKRRK